MKTTDTPGNCLYCNKQLDCSTDVTGTAIPEPGDVSICLGCAGIMIFNDDLSFRMPTKEELAEIESNKNVERNRQLILQSRNPNNN